MPVPISSHQNTPVIVIPPDSGRRETPREVPGQSPKPLHSPPRQEDTVTLSYQQQEPVPSIPKKPSQQVTADEKKSLLNANKSGYRFSVYG